MKNELEKNIKQRENELNKLLKNLDDKNINQNKALEKAKLEIDTIERKQKSEEEKMEKLNNERNEILNEIIMAKVNYDKKIEIKGKEIEKLKILLINLSEETEGLKENKNNKNMENLNDKHQKDEKFANKSETENSVQDYLYLIILIFFCLNFNQKTFFYLII